MNRLWLLPWVVVCWAGAACQQVPATEAPGTDPAGAGQPAATAPDKAPAPSAASCTDAQRNTGARLHRTLCMACHSTDGQNLVGPTFKDLYLRERSTVGRPKPLIADDDYLLRSIRDPATDVVQGYPPAMPPSKYVPADEVALVCFIKGLTDDKVVQARRKQLGLSTSSSPAVPAAPPKTAPPITK